MESAQVCKSPSWAEGMEYVQTAWREPGISAAVILNCCHPGLGNNGQGRKVVKNYLHNPTEERALNSVLRRVE